MSTSLPQADGGWEFYRYGGGKLEGAQSVAASGDTALVTPAANQRVTLLWVALSSSALNPTEVVATVKLGTTAVYIWNMTLPGAFSHWEPVTGTYGAALILNLGSAGNPVLANWTYLVA